VNVLDWADLALRYEEENRELRRILTALIFAYARTREFHDFARERVEARFPEVRRAA